MTDLKTRLENVGKKLAREQEMEARRMAARDVTGTYGTRAGYIKEDYFKGFTALSGIVVELAEACKDYEHMARGFRETTQYSSAAEALAKLEAFLEKVEGR